MAVNSDQIKFVASLLTDDPDILLEMESEPLAAASAPIADPRQAADPLNEIESIVTQPWERWAKLLDSNISGSTGRWDDPGEYPSAAGGGPLASYDYLEELNGAVVFEISPELTAIFDRAEADGNGALPYSEIFEGNLDEVADECVSDEHPGVKVTWGITRKGNKIIFSAEDFDASGVDMSPPDDY